MAIKSKYGYMECPGCESAKRKANRVMVRKADNGTLSYNCDECDGGDYAKPHQQKAKDWEARITEKVSAPAPAKPDKEPAPKVDKEPKPAPTSSGPKKPAPMPWMRP